MLLALILASITPNAPSLRLFGPGPITNLCRPSISRDCDAAWTNFAAHTWFGVGCPMVGHYIGGRSGLRIAAASCAGAVLVRQVFFHGVAEGPETRADIISGLGSIAATVLIDELLHALFK